MKKIITLTMNPSLDKSAEVDQVKNNQKLRCDQPVYEPGGGGINVSRAIQNLGGTSQAVFPSGGVFGDFFKQLLEEESIDYLDIPIQDFTRENLMIYEKTSERQYRFGMPGPKLSPDEWEKCLETVLNQNKPADFLVASGSLPPGVPEDFYARLAVKLKDSGIRLVLDTSEEPLIRAAEAGVFLLKPNVRELRQLVGKDFDLDEDLHNVMQEIYKKNYAEIIAVSLGSAGALFISEDGLQKIPAPTVNIRSKIGAGDSMVAGMVISLAREYQVSEVIRFGVAAGSAAVMTPGSGLCSKEDTERLFQKMQKELK